MDFRQWINGGVDGCPFCGRKPDEMLEDAGLDASEFNEAFKQHVEQQHPEESWL